MTVAPKSPRLISAVLLVLTLAAGFAIGMAWRSDAEPTREEEEGEVPRSREGDRGRRALVIHEVGLTRRSVRKWTRSSATSGVACRRWTGSFRKRTAPGSGR